ncbi:Uncharacterised protein [Vibrio cholerae]|nr:Uncharacterised protein [Vibrio cholerae]
MLCFKSKCRLTILPWSLLMSSIASGYISV